MNDQSSGLPHEPADDEPEGDRRELRGLGATAHHAAAGAPRC